MLLLASRQNCPSFALSHLGINERLEKGEIEGKGTEAPGGKIEMISRERSNRKVKEERCNPERVKPLFHRSGGYMRELGRKGAW